MIVYPKNWTKVGKEIELKEIENTILQVLLEINCNCISLSGGLDSSLILYYMVQVYPLVEAYTMGSSELHPDVKYSKLVVDYFNEFNFNNVIHKIYIPFDEEIKEAEQSQEEFQGDNAVRLFYKYIRQYANTDKIISCDGIDEFMCGYYGHQAQPYECLYYAYLRQLQEKHLSPLHENSKEVQVYLPYLDNRLLLLFSQIPISEKVDKEHRKKKLVELAKGKIPDEVINRRKYGFCDVLEIKN